MLFIFIIDYAISFSAIDDNISLRQMLPFIF